MNMLIISVKKHENNRRNKKANRNKQKGDCKISLFISNTFMSNTKLRLRKKISNSQATCSGYTIGYRIIGLIVMKIKITMQNESHG